MNVKILIAGAAIAALAAGGASAATHKKVHKIHHTAPRVEAYAPPDQPIQYDQLDAYLASHGMKGGDADMPMASSDKMDKMAKPHHGMGKMHHHHMKKGAAAPSDATPATPAATPDASTPSTPPQ
jgi:hypothetical protein